MPTLGYWELRGLAQAIRFLLHYLEVKYEEKIYKISGSRETALAGWLNDKFSLGMDFPNLPYYIDGDVKISQSIAILRYIALKYNMAGSNPKEAAEIDVALQEANDYRTAFSKLCYNQNFEELKKDAIAAQKAKLEVLAKVLDRNEWICGKISVADFLMYESLFCWRELDAELITSHPCLVKYMERFEANPQIKAFMTSDTYIEGPMNGPMAKFNGRWTPK